MESIVALAGRRIDLPSANPERFPARNIERVQLAIKLKLEEHGARWLVSSAAAGADLVGIKAAVALGIDCRLILFASVSEFAEKSVQDRGAYWEKEFERLLSATSRENLIFVPERATDSDTFKAVNERILGETLVLASLRSSTPISVAVWEGRPKEKEDFTVDFIEHSGKMRIPVLNVNTL
jgi:hypothetical protein